jgi:hypothetical protein
VGLDPLRGGDDMPTFEMSPARLTDTLFSKIIEDLEDFTWEYGTWIKHGNEEARARYLSGVILFPCSLESFTIAWNSLLTVSLS